MSRYDDQVLDEFNRPVPGVSIYVYDDAGALDTLTADDASPLANPLTSDENGLFYFNAADGEKLLDVRFGGRTRYKQEILVGPIPTGPQGPPGDVSQVATRAAMKAIAVPSAFKPVVLTEGRRRGLFAFETANHAADVALDIDEGIYIAPNSDPTGASGAWVRQYDGDVFADWFGLAGDDVTNDGPAVVRILDLLRLGRTGNQGAQRLRFGPRYYFLNVSTLNVRTTLILTGAGVEATQLRWAANANGIIIQRVNTADGLTGDVPAWTVGGADYSTVCHMALKGGDVGGGSNEGEYHGLSFRARAHGHDLRIWNWQGDGVWSDAVAGGGTEEGNANCANLTRVVAFNNRCGLFVNGADTNVWTVTACDFRTNRTWGVWDSSFLGNSYFSCHTAGNGWDGALNSIPTATTYLGNRYMVRAGQAVGASTNAPSGTTATNTWWVYVGAGGTYSGMPAWVSGTTFREGGCYKTDNANARNLFDGCYSETDQNAAQAVAPTLFVGGFPGGVIGQDGGLFGGVLHSYGGGIRAVGDLLTGRDVLAERDVEASNGVLRTKGSVGGIEIFTRNSGGAWTIYNTGGALTGFLGGAGNVFAFDASGLDLQAGAFRVAGTPVVGARGAAVADPAAITSAAGTNAAAAPTQAEFNALVAEFNKVRTDLASIRTQQVALLARLRAATGHGLIA